ncbi:MAG: beta-lactamase regulating signal transducer with metallopeptidase domain [Planctomycetaceae bacterium]|jgi:beta-lactamase regulating signal transducer with metallopeptidase domain
MAFDFVPVALAQLWQVTLLIFGVAAINRWVAHRRPHLSHLLWLVVLLKCVTPPLWASSGGVFCWLQPEGQIETTVSAEFETTSANWEQLLEVDTQAVFDTDDSVGEFAGVMVDDAEADELFQASKVLETPEKRSDERGFGEVTFAVWLGVSLLVILGVTVRWLRSWRLVRTSAQRESPELVSLVASLSQQLGVRRRVRLIVTESLVGPAVIGFFRVTVLIPSVVADKLQGKAVAPILAHELLHIRRGDLWVGLLQTLVQAMWWFHPLVWWVGRVTTREAERCCDEEVLGELNCDPASYARALLDVLDLKSQLKPVPVFPGVRPVDVTSQRLERIMTLRQGCRRRSPWWCWLVAIGVAALTLPGAAFVASADAPAESSPDAQPPVLDSEGTSKSPEASGEAGTNVDREIVGNGNSNSAKESATRQSEAASADNNQPTKPEFTIGDNGNLVHRHGPFRIAVGLHPEFREKLQPGNYVPFPTSLQITVSHSEATGNKLAAEIGRRLDMRADQNSCRTENDMRVLMLQGNVELRAEHSSSNETTDFFTAQAESLEISIPKFQDGDFVDPILCRMTKATVRYRVGHDADTSMIRAEEISLALNAETFEITSLNARKIDSLQVADVKQQAARSRLVIPEDRRLLSHWDTIRRRRSFQKLVSPSFDRTPLKEAIAWFRVSANLNIMIDESGIKEVGVSIDRPVTLELKDIQVDSVLQLLLRPLNLIITIDEESNVVIVTSKLRMQGKMVAAAYPVADLAIPKSVVVKLSDDGTYTLQSTTQTDRDGVRQVSGIGQEHPQLDLDSIGELITTVVEPDSWQEVGGMGTLRPNERTLSLVIRQTQEVHREISDLLDQLRRLRDVQVTLGMQTLDVSQTFFTEWNDDLVFKPPGESKSHRYMRLSSAQADELRNAGKSRQFPKVMLFNGQLSEWCLDARDGTQQRWHVQPVVSGDRRSVRLGVGIDNRQSESTGEAVSTSVITVSDGDAILVEMDNSTDNEGRIVGEPIPGQPRAFRQVSQPRRFVLIQPEVVVVAEEELDALDVEADPLRR